MVERRMKLINTCGRCWPGAQGRCRQAWPTRCTYSHSCEGIHTYTHTCMHTYIHTCMHTYIRTYYRTHRLVKFIQSTPRLRGVVQWIPRTEHSEGVVFIWINTTTPLKGGVVFMMNETECIVSNYGPSALQTHFGQIWNHHIICISKWILTRIFASNNI